MDAVEAQIRSLSKRLAIGVTVLAGLDDDAARENATADLNERAEELLALMQYADGHDFLGRVLGP